MLTVSVGASAGESVSVTSFAGVLRQPIRTYLLTCMRVLSCSFAAECDRPILIFASTSISSIQTSPYVKKKKRNAS